MRLDELRLIAFGGFSDVTLDLSAQPRQFHLIYGPNESGKTTCLNAICALLFGIPLRTTQNYVHDNSRLRIGGTLTNSSLPPLSFVRRKNGKSKLFDAHDDQAIDPAQLESRLGGLNEAAFRRQFGLEHETLVQGGRAILDSRGELGEVLFAAGAGVGQLQNLRGDLDNRSKKIFAPRAKNSDFNRLLDELNQKRQALQELQALPAEYAELRQSLAAAQARAEEVSGELVRRHRERSRIQAYQQAHDIVPSWLRAKNALSEMSDVPLLDDDFVARRRETIINQEHHLSAIEEINKRIQWLDESLQDRPLDRQVLDCEQSILLLFKQTEIHSKAQTDTHERQRNVRNLNRHIRQHLRDLSIPVGDEATMDEIDAAIESVRVTDADRQRIEELASDHKRLRAKEDDDRARLQQLRRRLSSLEESLESTPGAVDPEMLSSVLSEIGPAESLLSLSDQYQTELATAESDCQRLAIDLRLAQDDFETIAKLKTPSSGELERHAENMELANNQTRETRSAIDSMQSQQDDLESELQRLLSESPLPTESELQQSRADRDKTVEQLGSATNRLAEHRATLRKQISDADKIVDTMRMHQHRVARRDQTRHEIAALQRKIEQQREQLGERELESQAKQNAWHELWSTCHVTPGPVTEMRTWIADHRSFVERFQSLCVAKSRLDGTTTKINRAKRRLASAMKQCQNQIPVGVSVGDRDSDDEPLEKTALDTLHDSATRLRNELAQVYSERRQAERSKQEFNEEVRRAESDCTESTQRRKAWDDEWEKAIAFLNAEKSTVPSVVSSHLQLISKILHAKDERDKLLTRIRSMEKDSAEFVERVSKVADSLEMSRTDPKELTGEMLAEQMYRRLEQAKSDLAERTSLEKEREQCHRKLRDIREQLATSKAQLNSFCREAGTDDPDQLPAIEQAADDKRRWTKEFKAADEKLTLLSGGTPNEVFVEESQNQDAAELRQQLTEIENRIDQLEPLGKETLQSVGAIQRQLDEIDGGGRASEIAQSIQFLTGRLEKMAHEYARLKVSSLILQRSIDHYRSENESPVLALAGEAFRRLTCDRYLGLQPDYDEKGNATLEGVRQTESGPRNVPVDRMSQGTADAVYLALRLASLQHQFSQGKPVPLVIDDCLIQLDNRRTAAALALLSELSELTQVILFTHHQHLVELAETSMGAGDFHVHRL